MGVHLALLACLAERVAQPFETLVKTVTGGGASGLNVLLRCQFEGSTDDFGDGPLDVPRHAVSDCEDRACR